MIRVRSGRPVPPVDVADAIITYFRDRGRSAVVEWVQPLGCFVAMVSLRKHDPLLGAWNAGSLDAGYWEREPTEDVLFQEPNPDPEAGKLKRDGAGRIIGMVPAYVPLDLAALGVGGVLQFLEKGNVESGRGEFRSLSHAVRTAKERHEAGTEKIKREQRDLAVDKAKDLRRQINKIPFHRVGIDLQQPPQDAAAVRN